MKNPRNNRRNNRRKPKPRQPLDINMDDIDYKNVQLMKRITSNYAKILPAKRVGLTSKQQRKMARAIKRARIMALIPFTRT